MTHASGTSRITVVGSRRRVDVTVPAAATVIELLPHLLQLTGEGDRPAAPGGWLLTRLGGQPLAAEGSLDDAGVLDGELLYLRWADGVAPPVVEEFAEAVAERVDAAGWRWTARRGRQLLEGLAGVSWLAAAALLVGAGAGAPARWATTALGVAAGLDAAAAALRWGLRRPLAGAVAAIASLPFWALGGAYAAAAAGEATPEALAMAAGGACVLGAVLGWLLVPPLRQPAAALALAAAPLTGAVAAVRYGGVTPVQAAAVLTIAVLAAVVVLPRVAAAVAGLTPSAAAVAPAVAGARGVLGWTMAAAAVDLAAGLVVLGVADGVAARALCAAAVLAAVLRARHHRFVAEVLPLTLAAAAGALALAIAVVAPGGAPLRIAVLLASGVALSLLAWLPLERASSAHLRRWLGRLEVVANATLVPLAFAACGIFTAAADLGRRIASA